MTESGSGLLSPRLRRLVRSYALLILIAIGFLLIALLISEKPRTVPAESLQHPSEEVALWQ